MQLLLYGRFGAGYASFVCQECLGRYQLPDALRAQYANFFAQGGQPAKQFRKIFAQLCTALRESIAPLKPEEKS